jgi:SAM-dependent methyltransferase
MANRDANPEGVTIPRGAAIDFESVYVGAQGDRTKIRWDDGRAHPLLVSWLDAQAVDTVRPGARVIVVGCGLGHDARELARRGYDVTAFDVSQTAVEWARNVDPDWAEIFTVADLFDLPSRWRRRFDLVVEIYTVQALPPATRSASMAAIESLLHPHGTLVMIARGADAPQTLDDGPPWALTTDEIRDLAAGAGLVPAAPIDMSVDDETPPKRRLRAVFRRGEAR